MKKNISFFIAGIVISGLFAFKAANYQLKKSTAEVETYQGLLIYTDCKPVMEYAYLGTEKVSIAWSGKYDEVKNILIKNAKKNHPNADGIIISSGKADAIKFK